MVHCRQQSRHGHHVTSSAALYGLVRRAFSICQTARERTAAAAGITTSRSPFGVASITVTEREMRAQEKAHPDPHEYMGPDGMSLSRIIRIQCYASDIVVTFRSR